MSTNDKNVSAHYTTGDLGDRILSGLKAVGKDIGNLKVDDLAPVDAFHIRGRMSTEELARWAELRPDQVVLDVGCGLGGTARYLASNFGCKVVGVDLTEEYCRVGEILSAKVGLADRTTFRQASALGLPFPDAGFDVVWTEHVQMNIEDKASFYRELVRVLKPGGQLAFHDIFGGSSDGLRFPVPWADDASISHLIRPDDLKPVLRELRLEPVRWEDRTQESATFFREVLGRVKTDGWMPVGLHLLMGDTAAEKFTNVLVNLDEDRIRVVQAVMKRPG